MEKIGKYFSDCIFTMKGSNMKKTILRSFFRGHPFSLHAKFQVSYSTPSRFVKKMTYFCIIFAEKYFPAKYLRFYTSTKNFSKIRPKMSKRQPIKKKLFLPISPLNLLCNVWVLLCVFWLNSVEFWGNFWLEFNAEVLQRFSYNF